MPCIQIGDPYLEPLGEFRGRASREFAVRVEERSQIDHLARFLDRLPINDIYSPCQFSRTRFMASRSTRIDRQESPSVGEHPDQLVESLANLQPIEGPFPVYLSVIPEKEMVGILLFKLTGIIEPSMVFVQSSHIRSQIGSLWEFSHIEM